MPRLFTLDEANALLPRLRELLPEMQSTKAQLDKLESELASLARAASSNGHLLIAQMDRKRREAQALTERLSKGLEEINGLGCELKGLEEGLIDFPGERDGRTVYLCWKLGEQSITHWHDLDTGFGGRQPL